MLQRLALLLISSLIFELCSYSAELPAEDVMSGYRMKQFGNFEKNWHLVTVRFRKDTDEMRFVYANALAWQSLKNNQTDYSDGSGFAKVGIKTQSDLEFPTSAVPSGARRVQFMVRDSVKHQSTDGWGYALFDSQGKVFPGHQVDEPKACAACHAIVRDRGFVFSQPMTSNISAKYIETSFKTDIAFEDRPFDLLPQRVKEKLPTGFSFVRAITGPLEKKLFYGTLDEVQPLLALEAEKTGKPSILISSDGNQFSAVFFDKRSKCSSLSKSTPMHGIHTVGDKGAEFYEANFCQAVTH